MKRLWLVVASVLILIAIGAYFLLRPAPPTAPPVAIVSPAPIAPPPAATAPEPAILHPVPVPPGMTDVPPAAQSGDFVAKKITELLGKKAVLTHLQMDDFVRRIVATVDNLPRSLAPPRRWPINPTPGRFSVDAGDGGKVISANNAARYAPFVALVESVDAARAVALYQQLYPLFQIAYENLGYPRKHFNDRLVAVIDHLLATPEPAGALKVEVPVIQGPLKTTRPWLLYQFSDPALEGLSSGQKILLRTGLDNEKRLKAKLAEYRKLLASGNTRR